MRVGCHWRLDQNLVFASLGDHEKAAVAQGCDCGQGRVGKPRPIGPVGFRLEPESLAHRSISGAPTLVVPNRCLICSRSAATPCKCSSVARLEPRIGLCRAVGHLRFSGARCRLKRAAASAMAAGFPIDWQSALHRDHCPPRRSSMPCAGRAGRDSRRASHRLPSRCRRCCRCSPRRL